MTDMAKQQLINTAMAHLGEPGFTDIDADPPPEKLVKTLAQLDGAAGVKATALERHPWFCAMAYLELDPAARAGNWQWPYVFDLPGDFRKLWLVQGQAAPYELGLDIVGGAPRRVIRARSEATLRIGYTFDAPYEALTARLMLAMSYDLAARTAGGLQEDRRKGVNLAQMAEREYAAAASGEAADFGGEDPVFGSTFADLRALGA